MHLLINVSLDFSVTILSPSPRLTGAAGPPGHHAGPVRVQGECGVRRGELQRVLLDPRHHHARHVLQDLSRGRPSGDDGVSVSTKSRSSNVFRPEFPFVFCILLYA